MLLVSASICTRSGQRCDDMDEAAPKTNQSNEGENDATEAGKAHQNLDERVEQLEAKVSILESNLDALRAQINATRRLLW